VTVSCVRMRFRKLVVNCDATHNNVYLDCESRDLERQETSGRTFVVQNGQSVVSSSRQRSAWRSSYLVAEIVFAFIVTGIVFDS